MKKDKDKGFSTQLRSSYADQSRRFVKWINRLGLETTLIGRWAELIDRHLNVRRLTPVFLFSVGIAFLVTYEVDFVYTGYREGDIVKTDIKSPYSLEVDDAKATIEKRVLAESKVPPVYDLDPTIYTTLSNNIYRSFRELRQRMGAGEWPGGETQRIEAIKNFYQYKPHFEEMLGVGILPEREWEWLVEHRFNFSIERALVKMVDKLRNLNVAHDAYNLKQKGVEQIVVRVVERGGTGDEFVSLDGLRDLYDTRSRMAEEAARGLPGLRNSDRRSFERLAQLLVVPNMNLNKQETANRQKLAREAVLPVMLAIKKGQTIVKEGTLIQPSQILLFEEIKLRKKRDSINWGAMGVLLFTVILVFISYVRRFTVNRVRITKKDLIAMGTVILLLVLVCKILLFFFANTFQERLPSLFPNSSYLYLLPVAAGPMLAGLLLSFGEVVWLFTAFNALAISMMVEESFAIFIFALVGGIAGARGVFNCKARNDIYWAGVRTGLVNMLVIVALEITSPGREGPVLPLLAWTIPSGFFSGLFSSLIAMMLIPLLESVFNYTTDVKLMELSNLNHPLLKQMIVRAPGTYHHSLVVGSMVEAAAEEIGANPLLAKVSAYYHDIGKTEHAAYFIENQKGYNPHDHISPNMSKTVLVAHVKDGVELGYKFKLGKPIIDVVCQHHGTTLISFFYHKAKQSEDPGLYSVEEKEFRYPGPKPQFKEAALCMLADSIEAAARSLDEPHPMRLQNIVKNIIHNKFMDGQLDECNLTLRDLSIIEHSFNRILLGIYHQRIDYPMAKKTENGSKKPSVVG